MKYANPQFLTCNHCQQSVSYRPLLEVNARHAQLWSDGYVDSPTVPEQPLLVQCGHCASAIWLPELSPAAASEQACPVRPLSETQLAELIGQRQHQQSESLLYLRLKFWQRNAHPFRNQTVDNVDYPKRLRDNMESLLGLLDPHCPEERLLAVELLRQLGQFEQALALLQSVQPQQRNEPWQFLCQLVKQKSNRVAQFKPVPE